MEAIERPQPLRLVGDGRSLVAMRVHALPPAGADVIFSAGANQCRPGRIGVEVGLHFAFSPPRLAVRGVGDHPYAGAQVAAASLDAWQEIEVTHQCGRTLATPDGMEIQHVAAVVSAKRVVDVVEHARQVGLRVVGQDDARRGAKRHRHDGVERSPFRAREQRVLERGRLAEAGPEEVAKRHGDGRCGGAIPEHLEPQGAQHLWRSVADRDPHPADHTGPLDVGKRQGLSRAERVERMALGATILLAALSGRAFRVLRARPSGRQCLVLGRDPGRVPGRQASAGQAQTRQGASSRLLDSVTCSTSLAQARGRGGHAIGRQSRARTARRGHQIPARSRHRATGLPRVRIAPRGTAGPPRPQKPRGWSKRRPTGASSLSICAGETRPERSEPRAAFQTRRSRPSPRSKTPLVCRRATTTRASRHARRSRAGTRRPAPRGAM